MKKLLILFLLAAFILPGQINAGENGLADRLKGRILLQVEDKGEAWYVSPVDLERYYLGRPADAFNLMRQLGLGVSEADFGNWNTAAPARLAGRIVLRVQSRGEAYYIDPAGYKPRYLGRPADAFDLMRQLGLGIANTNLNSIKVKTGYGIPAAPIAPPVPDLPEAPTNDNNSKSDPGPIGDELDEETDNGDVPNDEDLDEENADPAPAIGAENCEFTADYHINKALSGFPYATRQEMGINYQWGSEAPEALGGRYDLFSVRWTGECYFEAGEYEFTAVFDDAIKAYFNDTEWIFNNWKDNGRSIEMSHTRTVEEGYHKIKVEYYDYKHNAEIKFDWRKVE
jgi:hypothetical protein